MNKEFIQKFGLVGLRLTLYRVIFMIRINLIYRPLRLKMTCGRPLEVITP